MSFSSLLLRLLIFFIFLGKTVKNIPKKGRPSFSYVMIRQESTFGWNIFRFSHSKILKSCFLPFLIKESIRRQYDQPMRVLQPSYIPFSSFCSYDLKKKLFTRLAHSPLVENRVDVNFLSFEALQRQQWAWCFWLPIISCIHIYVVYYPLHGPFEY